MPQRKRKDNPGKLDKRNRPLKTRLPVTGHPATVTYESDTESDHYPVQPPPPQATLTSEDLLNFVKQFREAAFLLRRTLVDCAEDLDQWDFCSLSQITLIEGRLNFVSNEKESLQEGANRHNARLVRIVHSLQAPPPPPPPTSTTDTSTQTTPPTPAQKPMTYSVSTNTDHPVPADTPARTYAEAATQATVTISPPPVKASPSNRKGKGKARMTTQTPPPNPPSNPSPSQEGMERVHPDRTPLIKKKTTPTQATPQKKRTQAVVFHIAPMKYKPGLMRRWIEEDNQGAQILGIRWLLQEGRRAGKLASSLVIYMAEGFDTTHGLRMGKRVFCTTAYNWNI